MIQNMSVWMGESWSNQWFGTCPRSLPSILPLVVEATLPKGIPCDEHLFSPQSQETGPEVTAVARETLKMRICRAIPPPKKYNIEHWLVVWTPLKNISQLGWLFPIYGKIKNGNQSPPTRTVQFIIISQANGGKRHRIDHQLIINCHELSLGFNPWHMT